MKRNILFLLIIILSYNYGIGQEKIVSIKVFNQKEQLKEVKNIPFKKRVNIAIINDSILKNYQSNNYPLATLSKEKKDSLNTQFTINLGKKINTITLTRHFTNIEDTVIKASLSRKRTHIKYQDYLWYLSKQKDSLTKSGYSFTSIRSENINIVGDTMLIDLIIKKEQIRFIDKIVTRGNYVIPKNLKQYLTRHKLIYNKDNISKIENQISNSGVIKITRPSETLFKKDSTNLFLYVAKNTNNSIEGVLGVNTNDKNRTELNGNVNLNLSNILKLTETINIQYRNDGNDISSLKADVSLPFIIFKSIGVKTGFDFTRRDSIFQNEEFYAGSYYQYNINSKAGLSYTNVKSNDLSNNSENNFARNGLSLDFQHLSNQRSTITGENSFMLSTQTGVFQRTNNEQIENQIIIDATISKNWHLTHKDEIINTISTYFIGGENILFSELKQLGGTKTIRGFAENSIDTSQYISLMTEYRRSLSDGLYVFSLIDVAQFKDFNELKMRNLYSIGAGIGILTKSGILSLGLANGTFENANLDINSTIAHINMKINF